MSGNLRELADLIGLEPAMALCRAQGGISHYIPQTPRPDHPFVAILGQETWRVLCANYGGTRLDLPRGEYAFKRQQVQHLLRTSDLSVRQIARAAGCTERFVSKLRGELAGKSREAQLPLFRREAASGDSDQA